ncbi:hypothetical protein LCGC14_1581570 [marine sediment metagenome]|uniref:CinA C-terminal domain-containing protein n=1 Tax=marine sediment metagenome TaxID=412755 RepID=A0A0F9LGZ1_9ZZZZ
MDLLERIKNIIEKFISRNLRMSLAESCTGGFISHMFTNISGASKVFERGIICYSNQAKIELLDIEPKTIDDHGAVSKNVVFQLAKNIRKLSKVDIGIGVSGIAGPTGGTQEKPVGLVFIGFSSSKETIVQKYIFKTDRITFKSLVLEKIIEYLEKNF